VAGGAPAYARRALAAAPMRALIDQSHQRAAAFYHGWPTSRGAKRRVAQRLPGGRKRVCPFGWSR
jgi:hypothetical protein